MTTECKSVSVADLKEQCGMPSPRPILFCHSCGGEYSANRGDYFNLPRTHVFECCGENMSLVVKRTIYKEYEL